MAPCELCLPPTSPALFEDERHRVILVDDLDYPGFCRVIVRHHVAEMTDLSAAEQTALMTLVFRVEQGLRQLLTPAKINLASLGNMVPHLHWHVIPRFPEDPTFPRPIWGEPLRPRPSRVLPTGFRESLAKHIRA